MEARRRRLESIGQNRVTVCESKGFDEIARQELVPRDGNPITRREHNSIEGAYRSIVEAKDHAISFYPCSHDCFPRVDPNAGNARAKPIRSGRTNCAIR